MKKRLLPPLLVLCFLCTGCMGELTFGDFREIDQLVLAETLGVDRTGQLFTVSLSASGEEDSLLLKNGAVTLSRALREMQNYTAKKYVYYGHTGNLLLGESAAAENFQRCIEFVERDGELRMDSRLFIVRGGTAEAAVTASGGSVEDQMESLARDMELMGESRAGTVAEAAEALAERGNALVAAVVLAEPENVVAGEKKQLLLSAGYAIVSDGVLAGWLDPELSRGANLLMGRPGNDLVEAPDGEGGWFAARIMGGQTKFHPVYEAGALRSLEVRILLHCALAELRQPMDLRDGDVVRRLEESVAETEARRAAETLRFSQKMGVDFCDLGGGARRASPLRFDRMADPWETVFLELPITVQAEVRLVHGYEGSVEALRSGERAEG